MYERKKQQIRQLSMNKTKTNKEGKWLWSTFPVDVQFKFR